MTSRRVLRVAEAIREVVSMAILTELKDPRIRDVTVTYVEVSADLRHAKVHVSVMGNETRQQLSLRGLRSAAGYLQTLCARRLALRHTPRLAFILDQGVKRSIEVSRILSEVLPSSASTGEKDQQDHEERQQEHEEGRSDRADERPAAEAPQAEDAKPSTPSQPVAGTLPSESIHPPPGEPPSEMGSNQSAP